MKFYTLAFLLTAVVLVECEHTFLGTNIFRNSVFHRDAKYASKALQKRIEYINYTLPSSLYGRSIEGILAYDRTNSGASVNVTQGGLGSNHVTLRLKSERGKKMNFDVWIYV